MIHGIECFWIWIQIGIEKEFYVHLEKSRSLSYITFSSIFEKVQSNDTGL